MTRPSHPIRRLLTAAVVCVAAIPCGLWWGHARVARPAREGRVQIEGASVHLGAVWETNQLPHRLAISNPTSRPIEILDIALPAGRGRAATTECVLPPRARRHIGMTLDLGPAGAADVRAFAREETILLSILERHGPVTPARLLHATVRRPLLLTPPVLDFGESLIYGRPFPTRSVRCVTAVPVSTLYGACNPQMASVSIAPIGTDGRRFELTVAPAESLMRGAHSFDVALWGHAKAGDPLPSATLRVVANVVPDVMVIPDTITFGLVGVGHTMEQTALVRSRTETPFQATPVGGPSPQITIKKVTPGAEKSAYVFRLMFHPRQPGPYGGAQRIRVMSREALGPETIVLRIRAVGLPSSD